MLRGGLDNPTRLAVDAAGSQLAYTGLAGGKAEIFVFTPGGGPPRQLTFLGGTAKTIGWQDGKILFSANGDEPFNLFFGLHSVCPRTLAVERFRYGPVAHLSRGPAGTVISRYELFEQSAWKRYRGGNRGDLWIDRDGSGAYEPLLQLAGNVARPHCIGARVYFLSDHEGWGNLYSCDGSGGDLRAHTRYRDYYARHLSGEGKHLAFSQGGDLHVFDAETELAHTLPLSFPAPAEEAARYRPGAYLGGYDVAGGSLAVVARGKAYVSASGKPAFSRLDCPPVRLLRWREPGETLIAATGGETQLIELSVKGEAPRKFPMRDLGRVLEMKAGPGSSWLAVSNLRHELLLCDLEGDSVVVVEENPYGPIQDFSFSPDGKWLAYCAFGAADLPVIKLFDIAAKTGVAATQPGFGDSSPCFDASGRYLFFLSSRCPRPYADAVSKALVVSHSMQVCALSLAPGAPPYASLTPRERTELLEAPAALPPWPAIGAVGPVSVLPIGPGSYSQLVRQGDSLFFLGAHRTDPESSSLHRFCLRDFQPIVVAAASSFRLDPVGSALAFQRGSALLLTEGDAEPVDVLALLPPETVNLREEWREIFGEAWWAQREFFGNPSVTPAWREIFEAYLPLLGRCATRAELSDLIWEMQGELGTSHAYESHLDPEREARPQGFLGAEFERRGDGLWSVRRVLEGDSWDAEAFSPLAACPGSVLTAIDGKSLTGGTPAERLAGKGGREVELTLAPAGAEPARSLRVGALTSEVPLYYREWVKRAEGRVASATEGHAAYIHIPGMGPPGFLSFWRSLAAASAAPGLILDVRYTPGGDLSPLFLEKLGQRPLGLSQGRWGSPRRYPSWGAPPVMVLLVNEFCCSDSEAFAQGFRQRGFGPLIGKRTWGGTVGFSGRVHFVDGGSSTQPQLAHWFEGVGWGIENHGVEPDVEIENLPQDFAAGFDRQLEQAILHLRKSL